MSKLSAEKRKELQKLAARPDREIDLSDIPEIREIPPDAVIGRFYGPEVTSRLSPGLEVTSRLSPGFLTWFLYKIVYRVNIRVLSNGKVAIRSWR
jgi:hypothetical protein